MKYERIKTGRFLERPNRFIAYIEIDGVKETVHVKNTGRCAELLVPGAEVYVQKSDNPERKTQWDLIAVKKGRRLINMDSQIPNRVAEEWIREGNLFPNATLIKPEKTYKQSRFDLYIEEGNRKIFVEVKGVTLEQDGIVRDRRSLLIDMRWVFTICVSVLLKRTRMYSLKGVPRAGQDLIRVYCTTFHRFGLPMIQMQKKERIYSMAHQWYIHYLQ